MQVQDTWLTIPELCEELKITPNTVYTWRYRRQGPKGTRLGRQIRFRRSDVDQWIEQQEAEELARRTS